MQEKEILKLKHNYKELRVIVDREEPWFIVDDIVALADIEDKKSAMERAIENAHDWGPIRFDKTFILNDDGREVLLDITDRQGAFAMGTLSGRFGYRDQEDNIDSQTLSEVFSDWLLGSATELIEVHWQRRIKDYEMQLKLEEKDRKLEELTRKVQVFALAVQSPPAETIESVTTQVH